METYKQEDKERSRELLWEHAVKSLTQDRATSRVLRENYLDNLWTFVKNRFAESHYLDSRELSDRKFEDWKRFGEQEYGTKKPEELKVAFFCGPEPENDVEHLLDLGVRIENIYAFEYDKRTFQAAVDSLHFTYPSLKIYRGKILDFLSLNEVKFDIVYLDFTGSLMKEFRTVFLLLESNVLSNLGVLIVNTTYPDVTDDNIDFLTKFFYHSRFFEYCALHGYDEEYQKEPIDTRFVESCRAFGYEESAVRDMVEANFECAYSVFQTRIIFIYANLIKPVVSCLNNRLLQERIFAPMADIDGVMKDQERTSDFLQSHYEDDMAPLSYIFERMSENNAAWKHFFFDEQVPVHTRNWCMQVVERFIVAKYEKNEDVLSDALKAQLDMISHNLIGAWNGLFCDVPMVHLWLEMMLHQFGHSYHQNTENHRRYSYTAKTRKMCLDIFTLDKCRMLYDTLPLVEYLGSDVCDETRQMIERMAMDAIDKHSLRLIDELYFGSALIGIGDAPWSDYKVIPKRVEL